MEWQTTHEQLLGLFRQKATGVLTQPAEGGARTLFFQHGSVSFAVSDQTEEKLHRVLIRHGYLSDEEFSKVEHSLDPNKSIGGNLVDLGLLSQSDLLQGAKRQVFDIFSGFLRDFRSLGNFETQENPQQMSLPLTFPADWVKAVFSLTDREFIAGFFNQNLSDRFVQQGSPPANAFEGMKDSSVLFEQFREEKELAQVIFDASLDDFSIMKLVYAWEQWGFLKRLVQEDREDLHNSLAEVMSPAADSLEGGTPKFSLQETMELPRQMLEDVQMATEVPSDVAEPSLDSGPMAELDLELARDELPFEDDGVEEVSPWMQRRWVQLLGSALIVTLGLLAVVLVTHPPRLPDPPAETGIEDGLSVIETLEASSPKMDPEGVPTSTEEGPQAAEGETDEVTVQEEDAGVEPAPLIDPVALPDSLEVASPPSETPSEVVTEGVVEPPQIQVTEPDTTLPVERMVSPIIGNLPQRGAKPVPSADSRQKQEVKEEVPRSTPVPEKGKEIKGEDQPPQGRQIESKPTLDPYELMNQQRFSEAAALFRDRWSEGSGMTYTIAVELACQHETLVHAFVTAQGDADFFVLPATFQGRLCFWVCYGRFATREAAEAQFKILPNEFLYFDPPPKIRRLRDLMVDAP